MSLPPASKPMFNADHSSRFLTLPDTFYSRVKAEPFAHPFLMAFNPDAAKLLNLAEGVEKQPGFVAAFNGEETTHAYAAVYAGHQFGHFVPQLGDGRALTIAEMNGWEVQLKGSGHTPYSRFGDGRAVVRSTIREYLCSEAMAGLGIPTTRALCIIGSDQPVQRERVERGAMLARLAPSHIRFGSFEFFAHSGQFDALKQLVDFTIQHYFSEHAGDYTGWLGEVAARTARMIADWQLVGFTHGVMNTDNMSILGLTLDYGPFAFMEAFDSHFTPNHSDEGGRYAYDQQPAIGLWNLNALAMALSPLMDTESLKTALRRYEPAFIERFENGMLAKLGLTKQGDDRPFFRDTLMLLEQAKVDYTLFFRQLPQGSGPLFAAEHQPAFHQWQEAYQTRLAQETASLAERKTAMDAVNPKYILRTHLAEAAIRKAEDEQDYTEIEKLRVILRQPFAEQPEHTAYAAPPPADTPEICLSCSS